MSELEQQVDQQLAAIAALVRSAVVYDLGADLLRNVYDHPRAFNEIGSQEIPAMAIWCHRDEFERSASRRPDRNLTIVFDYVLAGTPVEKRQLRWRALRSVWGKTMAALWAGEHKATETGAVLQAAGLRVNPETPGHAVFAFADAGKHVFPYFRGEVRLTHYGDEGDAGALVMFLRHHTSFDVPGGGHAEPIATDTTLLPAYGS